MSRDRPSTQGNACAKGCLKEKGKKMEGGCSRHGDEWIDGSILGVSSVSNSTPDAMVYHWVTYQKELRNL
jgi:hypothetical protein